MCNIRHKVVPIRQFFTSDASPYIEIFVESDWPAIWETDDTNWPNGVRTEAPIIPASKVSPHKAKLILWMVSMTNYPT